MTDKEAYLQKLEARMDQWRAELDRVKAKGKETAADVKLRSKEQVEKIEAKIEAARERAKELQAAGAAAWEGLKKGVETAWSDVAKAMDDISPSRR